MAQFVLLHFDSLSFEESVTFEDVPLYFTEQELASLRLGEKALYKEVVLENVAHVAFLGELLRQTCLLGLLD